MGIALSVFGLKNPDKDILLKRTPISSLRQTNLADFNFVSELGSATSTMKPVSYNEKENIVSYDVLHYSDTINKPIRVYIEDIEDATFEDSEEHIFKAYDRPVNAYQKIYKFKVDVDLTKNKIYVFTKKETANAFIRRFKDSKIIDYESIYFDLTKTNELDNIINVVGAWQNSEGRCKKKAYFGMHIDKLEEIEKDKEKVTSYYVEYEHNNSIVDLFISRDGRISTQSNELTNVDLINIFHYLNESIPYKPT